MKLGFLVLFWVFQEGKMLGFSLSNFSFFLSFFFSFYLFLRWLGFFFIEDMTLEFFIWQLPYLTSLFTLIYSPLHSNILIFFILYSKFILRIFLAPFIPLVFHFSPFSILLSILIIQFLIFFYILVLKKIQRQCQFDKNRIQNYEINELIAKIHQKHIFGFLFLGKTLKIVILTQMR